MQKREIDRRVQDFIATCRRHQLKITPQRVATFRALVQTRQHPTADMMFRTIQQEFPNISFDTVNRTLLTFVDIGVLEIVEVFGGPKRFDTDTGVHHHLHCTACGRIIDFKYDGYARLDIPQSIAEKFKVTSKRVVLKGLCETCAQKQ
jgi:Fur family transcriptional regulator, peroxide stress response regulator